MMRGHFNAILLIASIFLFSCQGENNNSSGNFSIYFLKNSDLTYQDVYESDINDLELQSNVWLSSDDITRYDFSTHYIYLNKSKAEFFKDYLDGGAIFYNFITKPFIVIAGDERIYLGSLISSISSMTIAGPGISDCDVFYYPEDIIPIECGIRESDPRSDIRIKDALINDDLYHGGISVELTNISILENSDTSTIQYTYTLKNNDADDLYIFDPDLVGTHIFHYYSNGIVFWNDSTYNGIWARYKMTDNADWSTAWYSQLNSNESMTRTVVLKGYPEIPRLKYKCYLHFGTPIRIEESQRTINNIRIWLGSIQPDYLEFDFTE